ncbi:LGFP repeat-containing protein [Laceyella putida]|uniref:LGFP repeat-containing protein n=1 Tax=Laceyella putida TaxID=110101 RepID=A0ABW2RF75_9BACL
MNQEKNKQNENSPESKDDTSLNKAKPQLNHDNGGKKENLPKFSFNDKAFPHNKGKISIAEKISNQYKTVITVINNPSNNKLHLISIIAIASIIVIALFSLLALDPMLSTEKSKPEVDSEAAKEISEKYKSIQFKNESSVSDIKPTSDKVGYYQMFLTTFGDRGGIYYHPDIGAFEVHGDIYKKWKDLEAEKGLLGYPKTDQLPTPDIIGQFNHFQGGSIYWTPATGAHVVYGPIRDKWSKLSWERGFLGYPISDPYQLSDREIKQEFEGGTITCKPNKTVNDCVVKNTSNKGNSSFVSLTEVESFKKTKTGPLFVPLGGRIHITVNNFNHNPNFEWYLMVENKDEPFRYSGHDTANITADVPVGTYRLVFHCGGKACSANGRLVVLK